MLNKLKLGGAQFTGGIFPRLGTYHFSLYFNRKTIVCFVAARDILSIMPTDRMLNLDSTNTVVINKPRGYRNKVPLQHHMCVSLTSDNHSTYLVTPTQ